MRPRGWTCDASGTWLEVRPLDAVLTADRNESAFSRWCKLLVAVTRLARFADHFSLRTTRTGWSFEGSPSRPAAFAAARPLRVLMPVLSFSLSSTRAVDAPSSRATDAG